MLTAKCGFPDGSAGLGKNLLVKFGPTIPVQIGLGTEPKPDNQVAPDSPGEIYHALIDSGATESCIDSSLAETLELPIVDQTIVAGTSGSHTVNMHLAEIFIPDLKLTITGRFAGVHLRIGGQLHHALIGRTLLQDVTMIYNGPTGNVTLSRP